MTDTQKTAREALDKPQVPVTLSDETWRHKAPRSPWRDALRRLLNNKLALVGIAIIGIVLLTALLAPVLAQQHPNKNGVFKAYPRDRKMPPSLEHPMGTDDLGRDMLSLIIYGARVSIQVGIFAVGFAIFQAAA